MNLGLLLGGKSPEHEVALQSAQNVLKHLDRSKYLVHLIGIDKNGGWDWYEEGSHLKDSNDPKRISLGEKKGRVEPLSLTQTLDVVFPVLHGMQGEDGAVQGLLKLAGLPFVGAGVLGSSIGMDKDVMKRLLRDGAMDVPKWITISSHEKNTWTFEEVKSRLGIPLFVKPANSGSSIGINKVEEKEAFDLALSEAFLYDRKVIVEEAIVGREIECSILGNKEPIASLPCEIIPAGPFHSYVSKYLDEEAAICHIPAQLEIDEIKRIQQAAIRAYKLLCCEGLARVDTFLSENGKIYINEINTLPGLTNMSPYAKMWEASGIGFSEVLDQLIDLALERFSEETKLLTQVDLNSASAPLFSQAISAKR